MFATALSQEDYLNTFLEELPGGMRPIRAIRTPGQGMQPPEKETLRAQGCPAAVRSALGVLMYATRCTRADLAYVVNRLARCVDFWSDDWMEKGTRHVLGYVLFMVKYALSFLNAGDAWEDLKLVVASDASFELPKSHGGHAVFLVGTRGSKYPLE